MTAPAFQWWVLRGQVPQAWRWWLACIVSGAIGVGVIFLLGNWVTGNLDLGLVAMGTVIEVISSALTGWVLVQWADD